MSDRVGVAVVGVGRIGPCHIKTAATFLQSKLLYVVDVVVEKAEEIAAPYGAKGVSDLAVALADPAVQVVVICSPTATHLSIIKQAAEAGKHVFCEKPIAFTVAEIDEAYQACESSGVLLGCAYQRRYDPNFRRVRDLVKSGEFGKVYSVRVVSRDSPTPTLDYLKISGGFFHDCMTHDIDMARYITGEDPETVYATGSAFDPAIGALGDVDTASVVLKFPSGVIASLQGCRHSAYKYDQRLEVHCEKGMLQAENPKPTSVVISDERGMTSDSCHYSFPQRYTDGAYRLELESFIKSVSEGGKELEEVFAKYHDARHNCVIADLAGKSIESGAVQILPK